MRVVFTPHAWADYQTWCEADRKLLLRLNRLIEEARRDPFKGSGKPEPLRGELAGYWSRRVNQQDRLVYRVSGRPTDQQLEIIQCREHY